LFAVVKSFAAQSGLKFHARSARTEIQQAILGTDVARGGERTPLLHVIEVLARYRSGRVIAYRKPRLSTVRPVHIVCGSWTAHLGLADFFEATLAGIRIAAKAGKTRPALRRIAEVASGTFADVKSLKRAAVSGKNCLQILSSAQVQAFAPSSSCWTHNQVPPASG
jgi:hypothetical protein